MTNVFSGSNKAQPKEVKEFHTNDDVDSGSLAHHHTLGAGVNQAARGSELKALKDLVAALHPVGHVIMHYGASAPEGYLLCNGAAFSGTDYPALAALLGGTNTPDLRDRLPVGASGTKAVGSTGGNDTVTLVKANIPTHVHGMDHNHTYAVRQSAAAFGGAGAAATPTVSGSLTTLNTNASSASNTGNGAADGLGSTAVNIQNKYLALNFAIKAL